MVTAGPLGVVGGGRSNTSGLVVEVLVGLVFGRFDERGLRCGVDLDGFGHGTGLLW
jgi:hypothetical protein